ncbi:hypothetical protein [Sciscionella sediminilitoris]|uniref:hypothetical protein n=1 Tax=Sciscionella sediminilitoris TaxID=1445613 RepID=UPI0006907E6C|nr:hypothetical protein [Sciscionella sp. SE31]
MHNNWWIYVLIAIGGLGWAFIQYKLREKRVRAVSAYASRHGWNFVRVNRELGNRFRGEPFGKGHRRTGNLVVTGAHRNRYFTAFEYTFKTTEGSGKDRREVTHYYMVVAVTLPAPRPMLQVSTENFATRMFGNIGIGRDLQLESEQFNERFRIKTDNDKFAYDVLHPRTMQWMLDDQRFSQQPFRFERSDLLTWRKGKIEPQHIDGYLNYLCDIGDSVPQFVWKS